MLTISVSDGETLCLSCDGREVHVLIEDRAHTDGTHVRHFKELDESGAVLRDVKSALQVNFDDRTCAAVFVTKVKSRPNRVTVVAPKVVKVIRLGKVGEEDTE